MSDERQFNPLEQSVTPTPDSQPLPPKTKPGVEQADVEGDGASPDPKREQTLWSGRTDWRHYFGLVLCGSAIALLAWAAFLYAAAKWADFTTWQALFWGMIATALISLFVITRIAWRVMRRRYRLTEQRLFIERGILSQTIDQTELIRVDDVRVHRKALDRLFRPGTIEIRSTDATDSKLVIEGVRDPEKIAEHLRDRMRALRNRSLFIENL